MENTKYSLLLSADIFANRLNPDQTGQKIWPDLDPNCLVSILYLKDFFEVKKK